MTSPRCDWLDREARCDWRKVLPVTGRHCVAALRLVGGKGEGGRMTEPRWDWAKPLPVKEGELEAGDAL